MSRGGAGGDLVTWLVVVLLAVLVWVAFGDALTAWYVGVTAP